jgi:recombination protein RecT
LRIGRFAHAPRTGYRVSLIRPVAIGRTAALPEMRARVNRADRRMIRSEFVIPSERLPPGFAERIEAPPEPPPAPLPAATAVLLRDAPAGLEVLVLRRNRSSGFVPGAYVFPGGRVDAADADPALVERVSSLPEQPSQGFWIAAARELFEESGVLLASPADGSTVAPSALHAWRDDLLEDRRTIAGLLEEEDLRLELGGMAHIAHWITPVAEPRRFDTHFFLVGLPAGSDAAPDAREMSDARWLTPVAALAAFTAGTLPMVFPTVKTIEGLVGYASVADAIAAHRGRPVTPILPRLVRTGAGVGIVIDNTNEEGGVE